MCKPCLLTFIAALFLISALPVRAQEMAATFVGVDGQPKGTASISPGYGGLAWRAFS
jgi:hypothetical protein